MAQRFKKGTPIEEDEAKLKEFHNYAIENGKIVKDLADVMIINKN